MQELQFDKYQTKGAYHWREIEGGVRQLNAHTKGRYDAIIQALGKHGIGADSLVVDLGCGDGALAGSIFRNLGSSVTGVDTSSLAIDLARTAFRTRALQGEFHEIQGYDTRLPSDHYHAVVCSDVIEHVREPDRMLLEIKRLLRPGGTAVLTTPIRFTETPLDPMHVQEWFTGEFNSLCMRHFGRLEEYRTSHPVFWYEAYTNRHPIYGRAARLLINLGAMLGRNPFLDFVSDWRCFTLQLVVLRKPVQ